MKECGFEPTLVVEKTSPGNFQAWVNHGATLDRRRRPPRRGRSRIDLAVTLVRQMAGHFGRLAGFCNRNLQYQRSDGLVFRSFGSPSSMWGWSIPNQQHSFRPCRIN